ncbi:hypothetical protein BLNAU_23594 [Blattamonas nauphoetae]|uniref:Uncharacterized protein n=1 Tax=Blattamonas nauphoetae TaxID=2049346 RepID=A0ABQ9WPT9_9EUKA|nr:hypothetical protein BLNAU_23594 [Blattamonas nauphoetae]
MKMSNISTTHSSLAHHISNRVGNVSIVGSSVKNSEDVLTSGLVPGMSLATSFFVANTTISQCFTNAVDITENNTSMTQTTLSASHTFINCSWTSTTSSQHGGAIFCDGVGSLTILSCSFTKCTATTPNTSCGGGLFFSGQYKFTFCLRNSYFGSCSSAQQAGSLSCTQPSSLEITRTNFSKSTSDITIPTTHLRFPPAGTILSHLRFEEGLAHSRHASAGAIDFDTILGTLTHSNLLFNSNKAGLGGAISYSALTGSDVSWFSCIFFNNTAGILRPIIDDPGSSCSFGNDLFFSSNQKEWNMTLAREGSFRNCFSNSAIPKIAIEVNASLSIRFPTNKTLLSDLLPTPSPIVSVRDDANDGAGCGMNYFLPCKTLGYAGKNQLSSSTGEVLVETGLYAETMGFGVNTMSMTITSFGNENPVFDLSSVQETFMTISNGFDANLKNLSFFIAKHPLIEHKGTGNVNMDSCLFVGSGNGETIAPGLISISTGALAVINTNFSSLKVGSGGLLKWDAAESVTLANLFFLNLETTLSAPFTITPAATLSLSGLYFERCVGASFSDFGVDPSAFSQMTTTDSLLSTSASPRTPLNDGEQLTLWPSYQMVVDGNEGVDEAFCWFSTKKCRTLSNLITRLGSNFEGRIRVVKGKIMETKIEPVNSQILTVTGESQTESIICLKSSENSLIIVPSASSLSLSSLTLTLPSEQTQSPYFSSSGTLHITSVKFIFDSSDVPLSVGLFSVNSGTVVLSYFALSIPPTSKSLFIVTGGLLHLGQTCKLVNPSSATHSVSIFSLSSGTLRLDSASLDFSNRFISSQSLISQTGGSLALSGMSIENTTRSSGDGSVVSSTLSSGSLSIASSSFSSCICSDGKGGTLMIALMSSGTLTISDTSFKSCSSTGNGGGIWIDASSYVGSDPPTLHRLSFGQNEEANSCGEDKDGRDVFMVGGTLKEIVTKEKWLGTFETAPEWTLVGLDGPSGEKVDLATMLLQTVLFVGKNGNDENGDGMTNTPFLTLHGGIEKEMDENKMIWFEIVESAEIGKRIVMEGGMRTTITLSKRAKGSKLVCSISDTSDQQDGQIVVCGHTLSIRGLELNMKVGFGTVFVVGKEGRVGLWECSVTGERGLKSGLVRVVAEGEVIMNKVTMTDMSLTGKASIVEMAGGRVWMEGSSFSDVTVAGGGVLCGRVSGGMEVRKTLFTGCRGERFGSVVRVRAAGSSVVLSECTFRDCWSGVNFGEVEWSVWRVGGGSVFVWMERKKGGKLESVDLSGSEFTNCILENTNTTTVSTARGRDCVGGSGFLIVGGRGHRVDLSDVSVSDCVCRNVEVGDKRGFSGGVVGWTEKAVQTDRRGMKVRGSEVGMVQIAK